MLNDKDENKINLWGIELAIVQLHIIERHDCNTIEYFRQTVWVHAHSCTSLRHAVSAWLTVYVDSGHFQGLMIGKPTLWSGNSDKLIYLTLIKWRLKRMITKRATIFFTCQRAAARLIFKHDNWTALEWQVPPPNSSHENISYVSFHNPC